MEDFEWAQNNLGVASPHGLQARGPNVYFAPNNPVCVKVVDLGDGGVKWFQEGEDRPERGYYVDYDDLERYCRRYGIPMVETEGQVTTLSAGKHEAGDPLRHGAEER